MTASGHLVTAGVIPPPTRWYRLKGAYERLPGNWHPSNPARNRFHKLQERALPVMRSDASGLGDFLEIEFILQFYAADNALGRRAIAQIGCKSFSGPFSLVRGELQMVFDAYRRDLQNAADAFNISFRIGPEEVLESADFFTGQRRGQCPHHSAGGRRYDMVERGRMLLFRFDLVEVLYPAVDAIVDRFAEAFDHGSPGGAFFPDYTDSGRVNHFSHEILLS